MNPFLIYEIRLWYHIIPAIPVQQWETGYYYIVVIDNGVYIVEDSEYIKYFEHQVSGTMPTDELKHYIISDNIDTTLDILTTKEPTLSKI